MSTDERRESTLASNGQAALVASLPRLLTVRAIGVLFGRSDRSIRNWVRRGLLRPVRIGRAVYFREGDVLALLGCDATENGDADGAADGADSANQSSGLGK